MNWRKALWLLPPLMLGVAALVVAPRLQQAPHRIEPVERAVPVRTLVIEPMTVRPSAVGFGAVKPVRTWEAVAEVPGQVVWVADALKNGHTVSAGDALLRIDDSPYRLAIAQIDAQVAVSETQERATRASLSIAERDHALLRDDLKRKRDLAARGTTTQTAVEAAERQLIGAEIQLQNLRNTLALNLVEREGLSVQRAIATLDLDRTEVVAPFDARITEVRISEAQYANRGQLLFSADGLDAVEVEARFPIGMLRPLMSAVSPGALPDPARALRQLEARVTLRTATHAVDWPARIDRSSGSVDPQTQTIGVVAVVDDAAAAARPTERPSLFRNTFVEVELVAPALEGKIVIPVSVVCSGQVMVVDADERLAFRDVELAFSSGSYAVVSKGLESGDRVVVSDLQSSMQGMLLAPRDDPQIRAQLLEAAGA